MMMRIKVQFDESKEKVQFYNDQHSKMTEQIKQLEDRHSQSRHLQNSAKSQIREKDAIINTLEEKIKSNNNFPAEKEKMEKTIANLNKNLQTSKDENEKKTRKIKELEKTSIELKEKAESLAAENKKLSASVGGNAQTSHKDKDKKIKKLEDEMSPIRDENNKLKDEVDKIKNENLRLSSEGELKGEEISQLQKDNKILEGNNFLIIFRKI
jgi:chromosome segregation ATPase